VTGYDVQTLMNYVYVATHVPPAERRTGVSWSHHAELAKFDKRTRSLWLDRCDLERLSVRDLRMLLRCDQRKPSAIRADVSAKTQVTVCPCCGQRLDAATLALIAAREVRPEARREQRP
jgi:hypothetical protein